jgi:hypothetical protein
MHIVAIIYKIFKTIVMLMVSVLKAVKSEYVREMNKELKI